MSRTKFIALFAAALAGTSCGNRQEVTQPAVDCSVGSKYEFKTILSFSPPSPEPGTPPPDTGWYQYADPTLVTTVNTNSDAGKPYSNQKTVASGDLQTCGYAGALELVAHGYNFWGAGFASWRLEDGPPQYVDANGVPVAFDGISFWARTAPSSERTFMLYVDDGRTVANSRSKPVTGHLIDGVCQYVCEDAAVCPCGTPTATDPCPKVSSNPARPGWGTCHGDFVEGRACVYRGGVADTDVGCSALPPAGPADQDFNGDGFLGPGDIVAGTECRIAPDQKICDPACYYGGVQPPTAAVCVPSPDECGNQFHTYITTTDHWQLFRIPFVDLAQWPCPNRLVGGINGSDIRRFEIKLRQGTDYDIYLANFAYYRQRPDVGG